MNFEPVFRRLNKLCVCDRCHETDSFEWFKPNSNSNLDLYSCRKCGGEFRRIRLFADSNSDWLDERWPVETLARFLDAIRLAPNLDVILLTKRPENFFPRLEACKSVIPTNGFIAAWLNGEAPKNVWLGTSCENQAMADKRIPELLKIPAAVRFLSVEPLLENVNLGLVKEQIDWIICGGESGPHRRDCGVEAIVSVAEQCKAAGAPCYVKQDCSFKSGQQGRISDDVWRIKQFPQP